VRGGHNLCAMCAVSACVSVLCASLQACVPLPFYHHCCALHTATAYCCSAAGEGAMLAYDPEARAALLAAHRPYAAGAEVFDSHGPGLSWADLVMDHGCVGEGSSDNPR
jgi:hypothetical protein